MKNKLILAIFILGIIGCSKEPTENNPISKINPPESKTEYSYWIEGKNIGPFKIESFKNVKSYAKLQRSTDNLDIYLVDGSGVELKLTQNINENEGVLSYQGKTYSYCNEDVEIYISENEPTYIGGIFTMEVCNGNERLSIDYGMFSFVPLTIY